MPRIHCVQPDASHTRSFLHQIAGELGGFARHYRTRGQGKTQRVCLILEIQNDLSRHRHFSLGLRAQLSRERYDLERTAEKINSNKQRRLDEGRAESLF